MQVNLEKSRSIIVNKTLTKFQQKRYRSHIEAINKVRGSSSCHQNKELVYLDNLDKFKKAQRAISQKFNPAILENRALIRRLIHVESHNSACGGKQNLRSVLCSDKINREVEKKKIQWENGILEKKLREVKKKMLNSKELSKMFRNHDKLVLHAQKIR